MLVNTLDKHKNLSGYDEPLAIPEIMDNKLLSLIQSYMHDIYQDILQKKKY